ncbi:metallophosphoesterase [Undibacterium cyanobacteriorum]|uniref:Metallophosphoesterase n=1 Tax=Undibacterium cyanobacteriorum TaxID=3073561 RepID=A0ABY9RJP5_9BURK|nr:metallophosphoesterase [Undibacterium sp. 20NA77.5]WMW81440.1 metallophosphoesterase [Undibacterium sp. 20NA77.5]
MTASAQSKNTPSRDAHVLLLAAGDIADCRKTPAETSNAALTATLVEQELKQVNQGFVVTLGDSTYPIGAFSEFRDCYDKTWGKFKSKTLPAPGNHEYGVPEAKGYFGYFGEAAGSRERSYYKKNIGTWRLISLNSNLKGTAMQEQIDWLKNELKNKDASCTLAFWHHPRFSTGGHRDNDFMEPIWRLLSSANIDLVLSGHDHNYERLAPLNADGERDNLKGMRSFVVGTGGAKLTPMFFPRAMTEVRQNEVHGVLKLRLFKASYDWEFLPVSSTNFSDRGQATCH